MDFWRTPSEFSTFFFEVSCPRIDSQVCLAVTLGRP